MYKKREFLQGTFGERNIILEQLFDRITFWSRVFFFKKKTVLAVLTVKQF